MANVGIQLLEIIESGLEGQEYVTVLSWIIQTYPGKELMAAPNLGLSPNKVRPLLDQSTIIRLQEEYLKVTRLTEIEVFRSTLHGIFVEHAQELHGMDEANTQSGSGGLEERRRSRGRQ